ncbi:hypothetical protein JZ751_028512, partial [Albula glossodonta]
QAGLSPPRRPAWPIRAPFSNDITSLHLDSSFRALQTWKEAVGSLERVHLHLMQFIPRKRTNHLDQTHAPPPNRQLLSSPALLVPLGQTLRSAKGQTCSWATGACGEEDRPARQDVDCSPTWGQAPPPLPFPSSGQADGGPFPGNLSPEVRGHL